MTTTTAAAYTTHVDSTEAGRDLARQAREKLAGEAPDAAIVFASSRFDQEALLAAFAEGSGAPLIVGSSSAGEFTGQARGEGTACALVIRSSTLIFSAGIGHGVSKSREEAARSVVSGFRGLGTGEYRYRSALVMIDALAGHADDLVEQLTLMTSGKYQFAGGGAGDDAHFERTPVFLGTKTYTDAVVALEILSERPIGIGVGHGWSPASDAMRVTEADGARLVSLNGMPAADAFESHAASTGQKLDRANPLPFFLHNILGIDTGHGYRLRVPLAVQPDGSVACAAEIPPGARVHIMRTSSDSAVTAASNATASAIRGLAGSKPQAALFFDCVATRLRMGDVFGFELDSVAEMLTGAELVGCNSYGQVARAEGQFGGFHNCTAVVMILPQ